MDHAGRSFSTSVILLVEEDVALRGVLQEAFEDEGYRVCTRGQAPSVDEVAEMHPDLMLLDVTSRVDSDGWSLVAEMKATPHVAHVPIVVCADGGAFVTQDNVRERASAAAILAKPFSLDDLLPVVATALDRRDRYRAISELIAEPGASTGWDNVGF